MKTRTALHLLCIAAVVLAFSTCSKKSDSITGIRAVQKSSIMSTGLTGTLLDKNGEIMRGTPMVLSGNSEITNICVPFATDVANWNLIKSLGFNTIRLCLVDPYYEVQTNWSYWTIQETLPYLDQCVANAVASDMNIIINYHSVGEQNRLKNIDFAKANEYWDVIAPRYADNDLVYYEIVNEPTFRESDYSNATFITNYLALYHKVRSLAPNRQIQVFSFNSLNYDYAGIVAQYADQMDWDYTSIAYHIYGTETSTAKVQALMQNYRMLCTEWDYPGADWVPDYVDGYWLVAEAMENINNSWMDWRGWGDVTLDEITDILIPDAMAKGYWWGPGGNTPPTVSITSPADNSTFESYATIVIEADASDADGSVTKVEFFANGSYLGEDDSAPYSYTWSGVSDGAYELTAVATDDALVTTTSDPVQIIVGNAAPTEIVNPGYETGDLSGWTVIDGTAAVNSDAHAGSFSCAVTDKYTKVYQIVNVNPNTTYTLSAWCKKLDSRSGCSIGVENYGGETLRTMSWTSTWEKISVTFTTGPSNTTAQIFMSPERKDQAHLVDDWELVVGN